MGPGLKVIARGWRYISVVEHVLCTHEVLISILSAHTHTHTHTHKKVMARQEGETKRERKPSRSTGDILLGSMEAGRPGKWTLLL
jgi:hypothetical protein